MTNTSNLKDKDAYLMNGMKLHPFRTLLLLPKSLGLLAWGIVVESWYREYPQQRPLKRDRRKFAPSRLSSLVRNGSESVAHLVRHLRQLYGDSHVFFQTDVKNAFNSVSRLHGLLAIAQHLPQLYIFILRTYRIMNKLWINVTDDQIRDYILSQEGSTQDAVDGGIFFNNAINETLQELNKLVLELGGGVFIAIADDIFGCIKPEAVFPAFMFIEKKIQYPEPGTKLSLPCFRTTRKHWTRLILLNQIN